MYKYSKIEGRSSLILLPFFVFLITFITYVISVYFVDLYLAVIICLIIDSSFLLFFIYNSFHNLEIDSEKIIYTNYFTKKSKIIEKREIKNIYQIGAGGDRNVFAVCLEIDYYENETIKEQIIEIDIWHFKKIKEVLINNGYNW